ncbi:MAG: hypothetical protein KBB64_10205 [Bacteroidia bacterium]|nr:hypothetical protein [Bacteroidia bacterium]
MKNYFRNFTWCLLLLFFLSEQSSAQTCTGLTKFKSGSSNVSWIHCTDDQQIVVGGVYYTATHSIDTFTVSASPGSYLSTWVAFLDSNWNVVRMFSGLSLKNSGSTFSMARVYEMVVDDQKNVYFTGTHSEDSLRSGGFAIPSDSSAEVFLVRFDSLGTTTLLKTFGSRSIGTNFKHDDMGRAMDVDGFGNIYLTGLFEGPWLYLNGDSIANSQGWASVTRTDVFTVSFDPSGQTRWLKACGSPAFDDAPLGLSVGDDGGVAITGQTGVDNANFIFGANSYPYKDVTFSYQSFVARYNSFGQEQWFCKLEPYYGGGPDFVGYDVATDEVGNVYAMGSMDAYGIFNGDTVVTSNYNSYFIVKIDSLGQQKFVRLGNSDTFYPYPGYITYRNGRIVTIGQSYTNQLTFDHLGSAGSTESFVVVHDTSGNVLWLRGAVVASAADIAFLSVSVDALDRIHVSGIADGGLVTVDSLAFNAPSTGAYVLYRFDSIPDNGFTMNLTVNGSDTVVCGYSRQIQGVSSPSGSLVKYTWWADNDTITNPNFVGPNLNASPKMTTTYIASAIYKGCVVLDTVVLYSLPLPLVAGSDTSLCFGDTLSLNATVYANGNYSWSPSLGLSSDTIANPILSASMDTSYVCTLQVFGCVSRDTVMVDVAPPVIAGFTSSTNFLTVNLINSSTGAENYLWSFGDGSVSSVSVNPQYTYANDSLFTICLLASNTCFSDTFCLSLDLTGTGIGSTESGTGLLIYNYPDAWMINSEVLLSAAYQLVDITGKILLSGTIDGYSTSISKAGLSAGIYQLILTDQQKKVVGVKLWKE